MGDTVVMENGRVVAVTERGRLGELPTRSHDGATIVPSFTDSHLHPLGYAALVTGTSLKQADDFADLTERLADAASRVPSGQAVMAQRLDDHRLGRLPTRHDLDAALPDRPVIIYRYCGHIAVASTTALDLAGIGPHTPDPTGGGLDRDARGVPTGVLRETAVDLVSPVLEPLLPGPNDADILAALDGLTAVGLNHVGAMVAVAQALWCGVGDELESLCRLAGDLPLDVDVMVIADTPDELRGAAHRIEDAGERLSFFGWKSFADGSLGGHTGAMWEPFSDMPTTGTLRLDPEYARGMATTALELGGVVAIHAIGDRAIDETLDVFDRLLAEGWDAGRLRIEHASVASEAAIARMAATGVIASVQPAFLTSEADWIPDRLGPKRQAYRFASMRQGGVRMIGGSDCPVERPDPLLGIAAATTRPGWDDDEVLAVDEALELYTDAAAEHFGRPSLLIPGSPADFVVVEGTMGDPVARVISVYSNGEARELKPIPWPD